MTAPPTHPPNYFTDSRIALTPTIIGHMISHIENKMPDNGYRSDEPGNIGCLQCVGKVLDLLHSGEELVLPMAGNFYYFSFFLYLAHHLF